VGVAHVSPSYVSCLWLIARCCDGDYSVPLLLVIKLNVVKEALQWSGERKCKVTSIKPNWQANWTYNAITSLLLNGTFIRRTDLETTPNMNWLLISLSVIADAFLHKGKVWADDQLAALWRNTREKQTSQESNPCIRPKFPKPKFTIEFEPAWTLQCCCFYLFTLANRQITIKIWWGGKL